MSADEAWLRRQICGDKAGFSRGYARRVAQRDRTRTGEPISPYRCPFAHEHPPDQGGWHVGHVPSMETVADIAAMIRHRAYPPSNV